MRIIELVLLVALAVPLSACGGGGGPLSRADAEKEIERDLQAFAEALSDNEMVTAYAFLSEECRQELSLEDFASSMLLMRAFLGEEWAFRVESVDVLEFQGDRATVMVDAWLEIEGEEIDAEEGEEEAPETLVREDGKWRTTDCESFTVGSDEGILVEDDEERETEEARPLASVQVGESFQVDADELGESYGEDPLSGTISIRLTDVETAAAVDSGYGETQKARGEFVVVHYEVVSDLNRRMQPGTQINAELVLIDDRERQWETADYEGDYYGISGDAAEAVGCDRPEVWLGAGFSGCTAAVFDVPTDAQGFALVWRTAGVSVALEPLSR